jgi:hypothetical protein
MTPCTTTSMVGLSWKRCHQRTPLQFFTSSTDVQVNYFHCREGKAGDYWTMRVNIAAPSTRGILA